MLRFSLKYPYYGVARIQNHGRTRLYIATRYNSTQGSQRSGGGGRPFLFLVGTVALAAGGTVAYAKYDPEFRKWLGSNVPYSEDFIKTVLLEDVAITKQISTQFETLQTTVLEKTSSLFGKEEPTKPIEVKKETPIAHIQDIPDQKASWTKASGDVPCPPAAEKRREPDSVAKQPRAADKPARLADPSPPESRSLADLEKKLSTATATAVSSYTQARTALREHGEEISRLVEASVDNNSPKVWPVIKEKTAKKEQLLRASEEAGRDAVASIRKLKTLLDRGEVDAPADKVEHAKRSVANALADVDRAAAALEAERQKSCVTDKYWRRVEEARLHWLDEMEILFPGINLNQKKLNLSSDDLDLFILHAFQNILFYQKELKRLETLGENRLNRALAASGEGAKAELIAATIEAELDKERRKLTLDFQKQALGLKAETEKDLRRLMRRQAEAHADHITDAVTAKEREVERRYQRQAEELLADEQGKFKVQLAAVVGRMKGMDAALKARADADKSAHASQVLWSACQALYSSLKAGAPGVPWRDQLRPLKAEICAVKKAAAPEDQLVAAVVKGIPDEAFDRGVFSEDALRERFLKVERVARQVALVPEQGGNIPLYLLSYLQSFLLVKAVSPIPAAELSDQPIDVCVLDTYDVLQRARYWLDRGDFTMALRYMNLLKGASRQVACDWMNETRILLETQQAANTLMAHAAAAGMLYL